MFNATKAELALEQLQPSLIQLEQDLQSLGGIHDPLDRLVEFFKITSPWHDREVADRSLDSVLVLMKEAGSNFAGLSRDLDFLRRHICNAGRSRYGINRTSPGEPVTADKVFIGDLEEYEIYTWTIERWKQEAQDPRMEKDIRIARSLASDFMNRHIGQVLFLLEK